ncbi:MAG: hypothetical protein AAGF15_01950 [Pseudomonadota bacterium]
MPTDGEFVATLVCPMRTLVNINSEAGYTHADDLYTLLTRVCDDLNTGTGFTFSTIKEPPEKTVFVKYRHHESDRDTWFTKPLVTVKLAGDKKSALSETLKAKHSTFAAYGKLAETVRLELYDNTIAIAVVDLRLDIAETVKCFGAARHLEEATTKLGETITQWLAAHAINPLVAALEKAATDKTLWPNKLPVLRYPREFIVFDDLTEHAFPVWKAERCPLMWVHRINQIGDLDEPALKALAPVMRTREFPDNEAFFIHWGTTYSFDPDRHDKVIAMNVNNQYFYCLLDCLRHSQKRHLRRITSTNKAVSLKEVSYTYDRQEDLIAEYENELMDYSNGLQDVQAEFFQKIHDAFRTGNLITTLQTRSNMIGGRIDRIIRKRRVVQDRLLSYVLFVLGGTQLIALAQNIFWFERDITEPDPYWGVTDLAAGASFNLTTNVIMMFLIVGAAIWVFRRGNGT